MDVVTIDNTTGVISGNSSRSTRSSRTESKTEAADKSTFSELRSRETKRIVEEVGSGVIIGTDCKISSRDQSLTPRSSALVVIDGRDLPLDPCLRLSSVDTTTLDKTIHLNSQEISFPLEVRDLVNKNVGQIHGLIGALSASSNVSRQQITRVVEESFMANDAKFNATSALKWANDFSFPWELWSRDNAKLLELNSDFSALVRFRQQERKLNRLNSVRVKNLNLEDSIWKERLLAIADGIPIITAPGFCPTNTPPPLRKKYKDIAPAINKQIYELYQKGLIIILPTDVAKGINGVHFSAVHWTAQHDKEQGRTLADPSSGTNPLNTPAAKEIVDRVFGKIEHPTIQVLMDMLIEYGEEMGSFDDLMLWKRDLAGAFTLVDILPDHVRLCAYELTNNLTMFYHSGFFGHLELPTIFNIINMASKLELKRKVTGRIEQYVDDFMAVSLSANVSSDMRIVGDFVTSLLGPNSINIKKDVISRHIDWIGWGINLDSMKVTVSRKNLLKCIHGLYFLDTEKAVTIKVIEKLASWCSRYSLVLQALKPLAATLHGEHAGWKKRNASKCLSPDAVLVIWIWRAFLTLIAIHPDIYARPILSFKSCFSFLSSGIRCIVRWLRYSHIEFGGRCMGHLPSSIY